MGKIGRKKDTEQKDGAAADAMVGPRVTKNTLPVEKTRDPTLQDVLQAITASCEALEWKMYALATDYTILRDDHRHLAKKVATTENQVKKLLPEEMQKERQKAMEAVASLSGSDLSSHIRADEELEQSGSDQDS
ncbi:hypothetical protein NDU88_002551 [Pleurodeles waltl]|uniref:Uncharacterized protein n=1 Tax=Pleurodeles waltl TaxID=8319 RepID=A0AAV7KZ99_PLEWA|nr:hypothetical protein NDU88_002551 [Pleurodeles waltl]